MSKNEEVDNLINLAKDYLRIMHKTISSETERTSALCAIAESITAIAIILSEQKEEEDNVR